MTGSAVAWSAVDRFSMTSVRRAAEQADLPFAQFVLLSPFPRTVDFDKWAPEEERRGTSVDGIPSTQHWLIPEGRRPRLYAAHSTMSLEEIRVGTQRAGTSSTAGGTSGVDHASLDVRDGERPMVYTCISDLAACCADSRRYEPFLTRSSLTS
jgi:hypothetical protein